MPAKGQFTVTISGVRKLNKKFIDMTNFVTLEIPKLSERQAQVGAGFAKRSAPVRTGHLKTEIGYWGSGEKTNRTYSIVSTQPRNEKMRPYHLWMHGLGRYNITGQIKSGNPRYMDRTWEVLKEMYPELIKKEINKQTNR